MGGYVGDYPGFYFDKEKGKYFKIGKKVSSPQEIARKYDALSKKAKALREHNARFRRKQEEEAAAATSVTRTRMLSSIYAQSTISREYGDQSIRRSHAVWSKHRINDMDVAWNVTPYVDFGAHGERATVFAHDAATKCLLVVAHSPGYRGSVAVKPMVPSADDPRHLSMLKGEEEPYGLPMESPHGKVEISPWRSFAYTSDSKTLKIGALRDSEVIHKEGIWPDLFYGYTVPGTIANCAFNTFPSGANTAINGAVLAAVGQDRLTVFENDGSDYRIVSAASVSNETDDLEGMCWTSRNVIAVGGTLGVLVLRDVRSASHAARFGHKRDITSIHRLNENQLVVAGFGDRLCKYDLRTLKEPLFTFEGYLRTKPEGAIDVHPGLGVVAGRSESKPVVQLWDTYTGRKMCEKSVDHWTATTVLTRAQKRARDIDKVTCERVNCIRFVEDDDEGPVLLASIGQHVLKLSTREKWVYSC